MKRKIFVSYKYSDKKVYRLNDTLSWGEITTVRHYVDKLTEILEKENHIYKGEDDGESLAKFQDSTIGSKLAEKIFDSSITIVLVSKGMKESKPEKDQWIPWEISYSLKEQTRSDDRRSKTNGVIAVVLPDERGSYEYYITENTQCGSRTLNTNFLFQILRDNMFNVKKPQIRLCNGTKIYEGDSSYIQSVKWKDFIEKPSRYIDKAIELRDKKDEFNIIKNVKEE